MDNLKNTGIAAGIVFVVILFGVLFVRATFLTFVEPTQFAYSYDRRNGSMDSMSRSGYFWTCPGIYSIHTIDTRPVQVTMNANNRVLNAKLVQFNIKGWRKFISIHGRNDYMNESIPAGSTEITTGGFDDILRSYAFDGSPKGTYPFLFILRELKNDANPSIPIPDSTQVK